MKNFTVVKDGQDYRLTFFNDHNQQIDVDVITKSLREGIKAIEEELDNLKTPTELVAEELKEKINQAFQVVRELPDEQKQNFLSLYPNYEVGVTYQTGDEFKFNGIIYRVLQAHTAQLHWQPNNAPSLYVDIVKQLEVQEYIQPIGSHDSYQIGDKVLWQGSTWTSIIDNNVWSPTDYPQGWQKG